MVCQSEHLQTDALSCWLVAFCSVPAVAKVGWPMEFQLQMTIREYEGLDGR